MTTGFLVRASLSLACVLAGVVFADAATTRAQAIAAVRSILKKNVGPCHVDKIQSISATNSRGGWRVTAKLVMSASGKPLNENAVWTVNYSDGKATPANQLTFEISRGCP